MNLGTLRNVLLVRIASAGAGGITRAGLRSDLAPLVEHRLSLTEWRRSLDELLFTLLADGLVVTLRMRLTISDAGRAATASFLGAPLPARAEWSEVRDVLLVGRALGVEVAQTPRLRRLESAQGLRGVILQRSFGLPSNAASSISGLRDTLARKAAAKSQPAGAVRAKSMVSKTSRARRAVERLLRRPREFASDAALLAELAAEQVGAQETSVPSLRKAILRKLIGRPGEARNAVPQTSVTPTARSTRATHPHLATGATPLPDDAEFCRLVTGLARSCAEGWPGNRRAYVWKVWLAVRAAHPDWPDSVEEFKGRLLEAHKAGGLTLAYADLRSKETIELVQASAVRDRNNEWHFIRLDD